MKKALSLVIILSILIGLTGITGNVAFAQEEDIIPEEIILNREYLSLNLGEINYLRATVLPEAATYDELLWESSDESVVRVVKHGDNEAMIEGLNHGTAYVTVSTADGNVSAECEVYVIAMPTGGGGGGGGGGSVSKPSTSTPTLVLFVTRRDLCMKIAEYYGFSVDYDLEIPEYTDVEVSDEGYDAIVACTQLGIVNGYQDGTFQPDNLLTNAEYAKLAWNVLSYIGWPVDIPDDAEYDKTAWYGQYAWLAESIGVVEGVTGWHDTLTTENISCVFSGIGEVYQNHIYKEENPDTIPQRYEINVGSYDIMVDDEVLECLTSAVFYNGAIYHGIRGIAEALDLVAAYDDEKQEVTFIGWKKIIKLTVGDENCQVIDETTYVNAEYVFDEFLKNDYILSADDMCFTAVKTDVDILVEDFESEDFYMDCEEFNIDLTIRGIKDAKYNLKLWVVDGDGNVVAQQRDASYNYNGKLTYNMVLADKLVKGTTYYLDFEYNGNHIIDWEDCPTGISPIDSVAIKDVRIVDEIRNSVEIHLANVEVGQEYKLFYRSYDYPVIEKTAVVEDGGVIVVKFDCNQPFKTGDSIYICDTSTTSYRNYLDLFYVSNIEENFGSIDDNGLRCDEYIPAKGGLVEFRMFSKGFGGSSYSAEDLDAADVYLFDTTSGKTVSRLFDKYYRGSQIRGSVMVTEALNQYHNYVMVFKDGYSIRTYDRFEIITNGIIDYVYLYSVDDWEYYNTIPDGTTEFYAELDAVGISDMSSVGLEFVDASDNVLGTGYFDAVENMYKFTLSEPVMAYEEYAIRASYGGKVYIQSFFGGTGNSGQKKYDLYADRGIVYNGKTYISVEMYSNTDEPLPDLQSLTYKLIFDDGTEYEGFYHKTIIDYDEYDKYFVVVIDSEFDYDYENEARLKIYDGDNIIKTTGRSVVDYYETKYNPFVYMTRHTDEGVTIIGEGFDGPDAITMSVFDDETQSVVCIESQSVSDGTVTFSKDSLDVITTYYELLREYGDRFSKEYVLEQNGELIFVGKTYMGKEILNSEFKFHKTHTSSVYEFINLPHTKYAYYRLADTRSALESENYQPIEVGALYTLKNKGGIQTVYGQFMTADGVETDVEELKICVDVTPPDFVITSEISDIFVVDNSSFYLNFDYTTDAAGTIHTDFYDEYGNKIGDMYDSEYETDGTETFFGTRMYISSECDYTKAKKLVIYMTDEKGNKSAMYSYDIMVMERYIELETENAYLEFDIKTGGITYAAIIRGFNSIAIPSEINGIPVVQIESDAFYSTAGERVYIAIPESVVYIDELAFYNISDFVLMVRENSYAHMFAVENGLEYEIITDTHGDINRDGIVNILDVVAILRHISNSVPVSDESLCDINYDGLVNVQDVIFLLNHVNNSNKLY